MKATLSGSGSLNGKTTSVSGRISGKVTSEDEKINGKVLSPMRGAPGLSAYEIWLQAGNSGTEEEFLASLVGPPGANGEATYEIGPGLKVEENVLSVDSAKDFEGDNTRPVEAAFMQEQIGNIELLLKTI